MVKKYIKEIISFAIGVLITSMVFLIFQNHELKQEIITVEKPVVKWQTKTEIKTDTIYKTISKPKYLTETVIRTDTIKADTAVNFVQKEYYTTINTDTITGQIKAVVSGVNPTLDTLQYNLHIPIRTVTNEITVERTKYKQKHWNFTVGVGGGYGLINRKADIFIGGMVGYSF